MRRRSIVRNHSEPQTRHRKADLYTHYRLRGSAYSLGLWAHCKGKHLLFSSRPPFCSNVARVPLLRLREQTISAATLASVPPVIQAVIGQIPPEDKAAKARRGKKFSNIQEKCNEGKKIYGRQRGDFEGSARVCRTRSVLMDVEAIHRSMHQLVRNLDTARIFIKEIGKVEKPPGFPEDKGVHETTSYYSTKWISLIRKGILQLEDSTTGFVDSFTEESAEDLSNSRPVLFQRLVRKGLLTRDPGAARPYPTGKAYTFKQTKNWVLHVHPDNRSGARAHYKPKEDEVGLGYHATNPVTDLALIRLGVLDQ